MSRKLTPRSSLESLRREAKRWLKAIRENDPEAGARLARAYEGQGTPPQPTLRDVQFALAREHSFPGWSALKAELQRLVKRAPPASRDEAITALLTAAGQGDVGQVETLLGQFPDIVNVAAPLEGNTGNRTALHYGSGHAAIVRTLLARGADPNIRDTGDRAMPLHFAAERGDMEIVRLLVEAGADTVGEGTEHELNVLGWATCFDYAYHEDVANYLLEHGARHTIHTAVAMGAVDMIREIAARSRAELDHRMDGTNRLRSPLHLAIIRKRPQSLAVLLELGANPEVEDMGALTPLDQAALAGQHDMAEMLIEHGAVVRLPAAVALDRKDDVERLLRLEPHSLRPGGRWERLIIRAAERGSARVVESLIRAGASVHVYDRHDSAIDQTHGFTALHAAASAGNVEAVRVLLAHGADPTVRDDKYWGTPAGWADHFGHTGARDAILEGPIDIGDALIWRHDRIEEVLARDPQALDRPFGEYVNGAEKSKPWLDAKWTPIMFAIANGQPDAARLLAELGANLRVRDSKDRSPADLARQSGQTELTSLLERMANSPPAADAVGADDRIPDFLRWACPDWRISGSERQHRLGDAARLLRRHPGIARENIYTAVVCGETGEVRRLLDTDPAAANAIGGPRSWPPLLYLCATRLDIPRAIENSVAIARLLLEHGADPSAFYLGGNSDIHYTALTVVLGRGEDLAPMHPMARELAALLLERGADPHDSQVLYNVFADNTSRPLLTDEIIWLLELMYEHSVRRGHKADWDNPEWPMFDMRGAPSLGHEERRHPGAHFMLEAAVDRNLLGLAKWMLDHGAGPNTPAGQLWTRRWTSLYEQAMRDGDTGMAELLVRYGAKRTTVKRDEHESFVDACLRLDREGVREAFARHPEWLGDHRPMFAAVQADRPDVVEMLLDLGVSPDVADANNTRALHMCVGRSLRAAELLIARGADVDARDTNHNSPPLGWASWFGDRALIDLLGTHSSDVWYLTYTGRVERLLALLREDPDLARTTNADGETPLMWLPGDADAALDIARLFVEYGADASLRNSAGVSAADLARRRGMDAVAELLR